MTEKQSLPPSIRLPGGEIFVLTLCRVISTDHNDVPLDLQLIPPDCPAEVVNGDSYVAVYVLRACLEHPDVG